MSSYSCLMWHFDGYFQGGISIFNRTALLMHIKCAQKSVSTPGHFLQKGLLIHWFRGMMRDSETKLQIPVIYIIGTKYSFSLPNILWVSQCVLKTLTFGKCRKLFGSCIKITSSKTDLGFHIKHSLGSDGSAQSNSHVGDVFPNNTWNPWSFIFLIFWVVLSCWNKIQD